MKVFCKTNNIFDLVNTYTIDRLKKYISLSDGQLNLELNTEYVVYGILFRDNAPWYYLCLYEDDEYPSPFPADLFDISDGRLSSYWKLLFVKQREGEVLSSLVFNEWRKDPSFYERLIDGDPEAVKLFTKYRQLLDHEY